METLKSIAQRIDHTYLKAYASKSDMDKLCEEAKIYGTKMVAINPVWVRYCKELLKDTDIHVGAAIGFPLGQMTIEAKAFETEDAIKNGADEIDYVINISALKDKNYAYLEKEMQTIVDICKQNNVTSKVIFENCYLEKDEIRVMCDIALKRMPDYIKTSTGFGTGGATLEDVKFMKGCVGDKIKVKAAGGIRTFEDYMAYVKAGAERIGTSNTLNIIKEAKDEGIR